MTLSASPYALFRAEDRLPATAQPIGIGQCLRIAPKKYYRKNTSINKKSGTTLRKQPLNEAVQLAFA